MLIDLHTHTYPCSPCSTMTADELIQTAMRRGLDAICVTDHLSARGADEAQRLARDRYGFTVFRGVEARTTLGDILVYGLDEEIREGIDGAELLNHVDRVGGAAVLAHPFRRGGGWGLWYWLEKQGLSVSPDLASHPDLRKLHAIETMNGQVNDEELGHAVRLAAILGRPVCAGSDSHAVGSVGRTATEFSRCITNEQELVAEIRAGRMEPRRLR